MHKTFALGAILLAGVGFATRATAATERETRAAIQNGLAYLHRTQNPSGYWGSPGNEQAATGAAIFAFLNQQEKWGSNTFAYEAAVHRAIVYLTNTATVVDLTTRGDGVNICAGGSGPCKGILWSGNPESTYTTGMVATAIAVYGGKAGVNVVATTSGPLAGMTWGQIAQGITNWVAASQSNTGGWGHFPAQRKAGASNTQWAVTALLYNETLGAITPEAVKDGLRLWLGNVQNASGAACVEPGTEPCNHADTGGWLLAMKFVGYELTDSHVQAGLAFLNTYWRSTASDIWYGNFGHPYAMWAVYRGLEATIGLNDTSEIVNRLTDCTAARSERPSAGAPCAWSEDYNQWLVQTQKVDGNWEGYSYWSEPVATAFYINILGATRIPLPLKASTPERPQAVAETPGRVPLVDRDQNTAVTASTSQLAANSGKVRSYLRKGITALAVSADGTALASAATDNKIRIWSASTGLQRAAIQGLLGLPTGLAFNPVNGTLTGGGRDSLGRVWDAASGSELARFAAHEHAIRAVAVSPDGRFLGSAGEETRIILWNLASNKLSAILYGPTNFVNAVAFSPDSRRLASAGDDARVLLFDVTSGKPLYTLRGHSGPITTVAFSPDGAVLASGGEDTVIHLWDPALGQQRQALAGHSAPIRTIAFSPDSRLIASSGEDTRILLWNTATGILEKTLTGATGVVNALVFDPRGRFLASATESGDITIWNVAAGVKMLTIKVPTAP